MSSAYPPLLNTARVLIASGMLPLALPAASNPFAAPAPTPLLVRGSFVGTAFVLTFQPPSNDWLTLQASDDALTWVDLVNVSVTTAGAVYADTEARSQPHRLYRLRTPGVSLATASQRWQARPHRNYRFRLDRISSGSPFLMQADIEVRADEKRILLALSDGQPLLDPDPEYFPGIDELFQRLQDVPEGALTQVWVTYDPTLHFPARGTLDFRFTDTGTVDGGRLVQYRVSNLTLLPEQ